MSQKQPSTNINPALNNRKKSLELLLPPSLTNKKTLVLDLDETLVHSQFGPFNIPSDVVINIEIENEIHDIHVLVRPGVKQFLEKMSKKYEIVIFTASISKYAGPLLDILDKEKLCKFRLFREHCTLLNSSFVKDLKKLGRDLKDVVIVDNSPMAYLLNSDNGLPILTWFDDKNDKELFKIIPILDFLSIVPDVRDYICKIVINNEISYENAINVINNYKEILIRKNEEKEKRENNSCNNSLEDNNEISDGSDNNLAVINQEKNQQQININIINNNITNYIYDNKSEINKENTSDNIINNQIKNKIEKHNFNPNSIIASVNKPENPQIFSPLTPLIKENKNKNTKANSTKNINGSKTPKNINYKIGQLNKNNNIHKKSESIGCGYKQKAKKAKLDEFVNMNNKIKNNTNKNNPVRNNTNYNYTSKSQSRKEAKIKNTNYSNINNNNKSEKILSNVKKQFNMNHPNISVNKKSLLNNNDKYQIKLFNDGNQTTVHNRQRIKLNINNDEKTIKNYNKKNKANNLIHSVDLANNEIDMYYHNDNFPFLKKENNMNNGDLTNKSRKINKFLKNNKLKNNKKSSSIDNEINKNNTQDKNIYNYSQRYNNIKLNNEFKYTKNKKEDKKIIFNHTLQEDPLKKNQKKEKSQKIKDKKDAKNNSAININSNAKIDLARSAQINPRSESMKDLKSNEEEEKSDNKVKISNNKRPKSSNVFKKNKSSKQQKQIKRNTSGRNDKNINLMKYDIIEILERRGIAKTNRAKHNNIEYNYGVIKGNYIINNINQNVKNKNLKNTNGKNKTSDNIMKIKTKDI